MKSKRNKYIILYGNIYALITLLLLTIFWFKNTPWFLIGYATNLLSFLILIRLEKNPTQLRKDQIFTNMITRTVINFAGIFTVFMLNKQDKDQLVYAFICAALGFVTIKVGIYTYRLIHKEKEV
ncbi:MAG: hypothetical protein GX312_03075 [Candidatus Phytoplasma sp.]|nr:hypothetical protein [Phytoplasma sp.]